MLKKAIKTFFYVTTSSEALLVIATIGGLVIANSYFYDFYRSFFYDAIPLQFNIFNQNFKSNFSIKLFIDDFLMAIFFLLIGLELKKEVLVGELSTRTKLLLPVISAFGGVVIPALVFSYFNFANEETMRGFAVPTATDIAFAYAVVKAFGDKISSATKVFLISLAVVDDLIAIFLIAFFYTDNLQAVNLLYSFLIMFLLFILNAKKSESLSLYLILGFILWIFIFKSGIHPSIAGVALAMFIPFKTNKNFMLEKFAHQLSPFVSFVILPIFAFANSGVEISHFSKESLLSDLVLGISLGLFLGKQIGVFAFGFLAIKLKICNLPKNSNWLEFYGVSIITGIGFTMSLFIGNLAFKDPEILDKVKVAVLLGSITSFIYGSFVLSLMQKKRNFLQRVIEQDN